MRIATVAPFLAALLCLTAGAVRAQTSDQTEDEAILKGRSEEPAKARPRQSREDDELDDEELDEQVFYNGVGLSRVQPDYVNLGEAINIEGVMGFRIPTLPWFALELDIGQTIIPGENQPVVQSGCGGVLQPPCPGATGDRDEFAMQALGLSAAFKTQGRFYLTGKYGYRYIATSIEELNEERSFTGFAAGVGYRWGRSQSGVELSYRQLAEDVESVGLTFFVRAQND